MSEQKLSWIEKLEPVNPEFFRSFVEIRDSTGAFNAKTRCLISMALHIVLVHGKVSKGVQRARSLGATEDEKKETVRMAFLRQGVPTINTGLDVLT